MKGKTKIKVQGHLDIKWKDWFDGMDIIHEGDNTILSGIVKDAAFMHGILNQIRDLNLKLISVNPVEKEEGREPKVEGLGELKNFSDSNESQ